MDLGVSIGEFIAFMTVFVIPASVIIYIANRIFRLRKRKLEIEAMNAAEKAAQYRRRHRGTVETSVYLQAHAGIRLPNLRQPGKFVRCLSLKPENRYVRLN